MLVDTIVCFNLMQLSDYNFTSVTCEECFQFDSTNMKQDFPCFHPEVNKRWPLLGRKERDKKTTQIRVDPYLDLMGEKLKFSLVVKFNQ